MTFVRPSPRVQFTKSKYSKTEPMLFTWQQSGETFTKSMFFTKVVFPQSMIDWNSFRFMECLVSFLTLHLLVLFKSKDFNSRAKWLQSEMKT